MNENPTDEQKESKRKMNETSPITMNQKLTDKAYRDAAMSGPKYIWVARRNWLGMWKESICTEAGTGLIMGKVRRGGSIYSGGGRLYHAVYYFSGLGWSTKEGEGFLDEKSCRRWIEDACRTNTRYMP